MGRSRHDLDAGTVASRCAATSARRCAEEREPDFYHRDERDEDDNVLSSSELELPESLCWREGVQYRHSRVAILSAARAHDVSLLALSRHLGVKLSALALEK